MTPEETPKQMRAAVWHGEGDVRIEFLPVPEVTPDHSLVKVSLAGICATDREIIEGRLPGILPGIVPGHEITGTVFKGSGGKHASVGDRVIVDTFLPCGLCEGCRGGHPAACLDPGELGFSANGGWAEFVLVPNDCLYRIPDDISDTEAVIAEPFAMTLGAFLDCGEQVNGSEILIIGSGMAAVGFAASAIALGARRVQVCLKTIVRKRFFLGIDSRVEVISVEQIQAGAADISVDSIGSEESLASAIFGAKRKGLVICYGLAKQSVSNFPLGDVVLRNIRLAGHTNPKGVWPTLLSLLRNGSLSTRGLVDSFIAIEEVPNRALMKTGFLRTIIDMTLTPPSN